MQTSTIRDVSQTIQLAYFQRDVRRFIMFQLTKTLRSSAQENSKKTTTIDDENMNLEALAGDAWLINQIIELKTLKEDATTST